MESHVLTFLVAFIMGFANCYISFKNDATQGKTVIFDGVPYVFQEKK